jgi:hypothetical protein
MMKLAGLISLVFLTFITLLLAAQATQKPEELAQKSAEAQTPQTASFLPSVSISLPADVLSETVQISYFLVGPFGGYGGYVAQRTGVHSYEIPTMVEDKAATEIRMIVYASSCEIQQFVLLLTEHSRGQPGVPMSTRRDR